MSHRIPETQDIAALSKNSNAGEEVHDELLCHQEVKEPSPGLGVPKKSEHEEHERNATKCAAHDCCNHISQPYPVLKLQIREVPPTQGFRHKHCLHCIYSLSIVEIEKVPSPASRKSYSLHYQLQNSKDLSMSAFVMSAF
jgi:hypothetical protein